MRRWTWTAVLLVLGLAVSAAALVSLRPSMPGAQAPAPEALSSLATRRIVHAFVATQPASLTADLAELYGGEGRRALLDPAEALPVWDRYPYGDAAGLALYARTCRAEDAPTSVHADLAKALAWQKAACGHTPPPGDAFFDAPPFMHPSGHSFVALALPGHGTAWTRARAHLLHATELAAVGTDDPSLRLVRDLDRASLRALARGDDLVLGDLWVIIRAARGLHETRDLVQAFPRALWDDHLRRSDLLLAPRRSATTCDAPASPDLCWTVKPASPVRTAALASAVTLALALGSLLVWRVRAERRAEAYRALVLRTLTHELRTPATSLALGLEPLRRAYDDIPPGLQETLLRACDDAERIKRVIAVSARWLSLQEGGKTALAIERLPTATAFVRSIVEEYGDDVTLVPPPDDRALSTDAGWLQVAVKNLVDNALAHGKPPVVVTMRWRGDRLAVEVVDGGDTRGVSLPDLAREFQRGPSSNGLGLGLAIVSRAATALGGALEHHADPTTFRLVVADLRGRG